MCRRLADTAPASSSSERLNGDRRSRTAEPARPASTAAAHGSSAIATTTSASNELGDLVSCIRTAADQCDDRRDRARRELRRELRDALDPECRRCGRTRMLAVGDDDDAGLENQRRQTAAQPAAVGDHHGQIERRQHWQHRRCWQPVRPPPPQPPGSGATSTSTPDGARCTIDWMVAHEPGVDDAATSARPGDRGTSSHAARQPPAGSNSATMHGSPNGQATPCPVL